MSIGIIFLGLNLLILSCSSEQPKTQKIKKIASDTTKHEICYISYFKISIYEFQVVEWNVVDLKFGKTIKFYKDTTLYNMSEIIDEVNNRPNYEDYEPESDDVYNGPL